MAGDFPDVNAFQPYIAPVRLEGSQDTIPGDRVFLLPVCTTRERLAKMLSALEFARRRRLFDDDWQDDADMDHMIDVLRALAFIDDPENSGCVPVDRLYRLRDCILEASTDGGETWSAAPGSTPVTECVTDGRDPEFRARPVDGGRLIEWRYVGEGDTAWRALIAITDPVDGRDPEFRVVQDDDARLLQWRYVGDDATQWQTLTDLCIDCPDDDPVFPPPNFVGDENRCAASVGLMTWLERSFQDFLNAVDADLTSATNALNIWDAVFSSGIGRFGRRNAVIQIIDEILTSEPDLEVIEASLTVARREQIQCELYCFDENFFNTAMFNRIGQIADEIGYGEEDNNREFSRFVQGFGFDVLRDRWNVYARNEDASSCIPCECLPPLVPSDLLVRFVEGNSSVGEGSISHNVGISLTIADTSRITDEPLTVTVSRSGTASISDVSVPTSVTFPAGSASGSVVNLILTMTDDQSIEPDETVVLSLPPDPAYSVGIPGDHVVTIVDNDEDRIIALPSANYPPGTVTPTGGGTYRLTSDPRPDGTHTVYIVREGGGLFTVNLAALVSGQWNACNNPQGILDKVFALGNSFQCDTLSNAPGTYFQLGFYAFAPFVIDIGVSVP